ncbi:MAG: ABC transporter ATP-binding protein [Pseudoxanthomonas spadix]|nr:MAG: ABC transporter ATP-binding protein [Pseudoxanthomonas spadix]
MFVERLHNTEIMRTTRLLLHLMGNERLYVVGWIGSLAASTAAMLVIPTVMRRVIDQGFNGLGHINTVFISLGAIALVLALTTAARLYFVSALGDKVVSRLRKTLFSRLVTRELDFHHQHPSAELLSRLTTDSEYARILISAGFSVALRSALTLAGATFMMFATLPSLAALTAVAVPIAVFPIILSARRLRRMSREHVDLLVRAKIIASEVLGYIRAVKEFTRESHEATRYARAIDESTAGSMRRTVAQSAMAALAIALTFGAIVFVLWVGARQVASGGITAGVLGQFILYAIFAGSAVAELLETWGTLQRSAGAVDRIAELFDAPGEFNEGLPSLPPPTGEIRFESIKFAYRSNLNKEILDNFNLSIRAGETIAIVGASGAGKSTLLSLLTRLYEPQQGRILLDGHDISMFNLASVRSAFGVVPQVNAIFSCSARENIRYGHLQATDVEVKNAAIAAEADDFIESLVEGFDEPLGERGAKLSGGQQQRISIARAILKNAPILLLDEATSALDAHTEQIVQIALRRLMANRTTIVIAHRLSTVMKADRIIVMDRGAIIGDGTHYSLMNTCPKYADLVRIQFNYQSEDSISGVWSA